MVIDAENASFNRRTYLRKLQSTLAIGALVTHVMKNRGEVTMLERFLV